MKQASLTKIHYPLEKHHYDTDDLDYVLNNDKKATFSLTTPVVMIAPESELSNYMFAIRFYCKRLFISTVWEMVFLPLGSILKHNIPGVKISYGPKKSQK